MSEDPSEMSLREARDYYLDRRQAGATDQTLSSYQYRLAQFVSWCECEDILIVSEIDGWSLDRFTRHRRSDLEPISLKGQMSSVKKFIEWLEQIEAVDEGLSRKVAVPKVSRDQQTSDTLLEESEAKRLLNYYRNSPAEYGRTRHVILEILWNTGCRLGGLRALDLSDYDSEEQRLHFRHRPESGTPLKNGLDGQRVIAIPSKISEAIDYYINRERSDRRDDSGREPLISGRQGRLSATSIRAYANLATQPCVHMQCPHRRKKSTCDYRFRNHATKCESSRSPHPIRTGSITWQLNRGIPLEVVAERVNAAPETIKRFYDKASDLDRLEERRERYTGDLDIESEDESEEGSEDESEDE